MNAALLLDAVGVPRDAFTQVFAIARSAGWLANALEQQKTGRMIRPASNYVGPKPGYELTLAAPRRMSARTAALKTRRNTADE